VSARVRLLALGGIIGPLTFIGCWAIAGAVTHGYSAIDDTISDLAAVGATTRVSMTVGFVVFGVGLVAFGLALRRALGGGAWIAAITTGACTIAVAATPLGGWSGDSVHAAFAGLGYASIVLLPALAAPEFAARGRTGWSRAAWLTALAAAACLLASTFAPGHGAWQRLGLSIGDVWIVSAAAALATASGPFDLGSARGRPLE
jgi:hypothetical membrane protein